MNSLKPVLPMFHGAAGLKRLLVAGFAVLLLGVLTAIPTLAAGSGTWTLTGSLNVSRAAHSATLLQNGQVLVAGGEDYNATSLPVPNSTIPPRINGRSPVV